MIAKTKELDNQKTILSYYGKSITIIDLFDLK